MWLYLGIALAAAVAVAYLAFLKAHGKRPEGG